MNYYRITGDYQTIVDNLLFLTYNSQQHRFLRVNSSYANYAMIKDKVYHIASAEEADEVRDKYPHIFIVRISEEEYNNLKPV